MGIYISGVILLGSGVALFGKDIIYNSSSCKDNTFDGVALNINPNRTSI